MSFQNKKKGKKQMQINSIESTIKYLEEHEYFLDQLMNNKESIYQEKISNIQDSMEEFLQHPNNDLLREELKQEYIHMLKDILDDIEEQKIEEQKINNDPTTVKLNEAIFAVGGHVAPIPDRPKTRKELREERIRQEKLLSEARKEPEKEEEVEDPDPDPGEEEFDEQNGQYSEEDTNELNKQK